MPFLHESAAIFRTPTLPTRDHFVVLSLPHPSARGPKTTTTRATNANHKNHKTMIKSKPETAQDALREKRRQQSAKRVQALLQAAEDKQAAKTIRKTKEDQQAPAMASALQELAVQDQAGGFPFKKQLVLQAKSKHSSKEPHKAWRDLGPKHYGHRIKTGIELVMWARLHGNTHHHHRLIERTETVLVAQREL